jgi:hypothetical protein
MSSGFTSEKGTVHRLLWESERCHFFVAAVDVTFRQMERYNYIMGNDAASEADTVVETMQRKDAYKLRIKL